MNKYFAIALYLLAIVMLVPGLMLPVLTIKATADKQQILKMTFESVFATNQSGSFMHNMMQSLLSQINVDGTIQVFEKTRSILGTVIDLVDSGHWVVAVLIGLFAVIIPLIKIALVMVSIFIQSTVVKNRLFAISARMSKWSMSDVFVMALLVTFLAVNANEQSIQAVQMQAQLGVGFYCFAGYCLLAIAAGQTMNKFDSSANSEMQKT